MSNSIFNSLGSHYDGKTVAEGLRSALFVATEFIAAHIGITRQEYPELLKLRSWMKAVSQPEAEAVFSFYKGRDAIEYALRVHEIGVGDAVLTQAFSCHAVPAAIQRAGAMPVFTDIDPKTVNPSVETLKEALKKARKDGLEPRAVLIQHTLGLPAPMQDISDWCRSEDLLLIEDIAQALGAEIPDMPGAVVGSVGDCTVFSFGRDKVLDGVSGGGLVIRTLPRDIPLPHIGRAPWGSSLRDMLYPALTWIIRTTYSLGIGKVLHRLARALGLLSSPIAAPTDEVTQLPASHARVINVQRQRLDQLQAHRTARFVEYQEACKEMNIDHSQLLGSARQQATASHLRFSLRVPEPQKAIQALAEEAVYVSDRWYRCAVDSGSLSYSQLYEDGSCPVAEQLARTVINLPTHMSVSAKDISRIIKRITQAY